MSDPPIQNPIPADPAARRTFKVAPTKGDKTNVISVKAKGPPPPATGNDPVAVLTAQLSRITAENPKHFWEGMSGYIVRVVGIALRETRTPVPSGATTKQRALQVLGSIFRQNSGWADDATAGGQMNLHWRFVDGGEPFGARPPGSNQLGHFLTGLGHRMSGAAMATDQVLAMDIGHELVKGDALAAGAGTPFVGAFKTALANLDSDPTHQVNLAQLDVDIAPAIKEYVKQVLTGSLNPGVNPDVKDAGKEGFSVQDLRLTAMAWHLGDMVMNGAFGSVDDLNTWLKNNLGTHASDPESGAPPPANPSGPLLNDLDFKTKS